MANIKISELDAVTSLDGTELIEVVQGGTNKKATVSQVLPYKVYTALLSQTGTDAPVATVLQNTLGGEVVWTRDDVGQYTGTLAGAFTNTAVFGSGFVSNGRSSVNIYVGDADTIGVKSIDPSNVQYDGILSETTIEIRVYP